MIDLKRIRVTELLRSRTAEGTCAEANSKQQTANSKQQTANSKQQTANSKQQTANSKQQTAYE
jgi:hypothetical protein